MTSPYIPFTGDISQYGSGPEHQFFQLDLANQALSSAVDPMRSPAAAPAPVRNNAPGLEAAGPDVGGSAGFNANRSADAMHTRGRADLTLGNIANAGKIALGMGGPMGAFMTAANLARNPDPFTGYSGYDADLVDAVRNQRMTVDAADREQVGRHEAYGGGGRGAVDSHGQINGGGRGSVGGGITAGGPRATGGRVGDLNAAKRAAIPAAAFGIPGERKYPMPDASHAANAKGRAKQQLKAGHLARAQYQHIVAMANRKLANGYWEGGPVQQSQPVRRMDAYSPDGRRGLATGGRVQATAHDTATRQGISDREMEDQNMRLDVDITVPGQWAARKGVRQRTPQDWAAIKRYTEFWGEPPVASDSDNREGGYPGGSWHDWAAMPTSEAHFADGGPVQRNQPVRRMDAYNPDGRRGLKDGGRVGYASGGVVGGIKSKTPGRADKVKANAIAGSYIIPADVVSSLGQGNTDAGMDYLQKRHDALMERVPRGGRDYARGGSVPVQVSGGEFAMHPAAVAAMGGGSDELGAKKLDTLIAQVRQQTARVMPSLPGPR